MGFVKYSEAKLDLVGNDVPDWVEDKEEEDKVKASREKKDKQKDD